MARRDYWHAELRASEVIAKKNISVLPIDPFAIAAGEKIHCEKINSVSSAISGCLLKSGDQFGIFYSDLFPNDGFRRFTVAHELGHYFLDGHYEYIFANGSVRHESDSGFISEDRYEREADTFAAALLMPETLFKTAARITPGLRAAETLAAQCGTSLTATAIRYAVLSDDPIAVICSKDNRVQFAFMSDLFKQRRDLTWPKKNSGIPEGTATHRFNRDPKNILQSKRVNSSSPMDAWFDCGGTEYVNEEVVGLGPSYGLTLTILVAELPRDPDHEEESEEDDFENMLPSDRWRQPRDD